MNSGQNFDISVVIQQYHELGSCAKVAELYGCGSSTIQRLLKSNDIPLTGWRHPDKVKKHRFKVTQESEKQVVELFNSTHSYKECCQTLGCSTTTLYRILDKYGIRYAKINAWINSPQADAVAEYYVQGHSVTETAEHFGVSKAQVNNLAKARGLTNGRKFQSARVENQKKEAERKLAERIIEIGFEYLGGYTDSDGKVKIRCCECGMEYERTVGFLQRGNVVCLECQKKETQRRNEEKKRLEAQQAKVRKIEREWYKATHPPKPKNSYAEQHEVFLNREGICEICGKPYTVRDYVKSCGSRYARDSGVCSKECHDIKLRESARERHKGRRDNHRHRARKYGSEYDPSVTLKKLIKRDGMRCAICGGMCDWGDRSWSKYTGPLYPSIDHIIPMAKGGPHTWSNVQVAHIICNSEKGDRIEI